MKTPREIIDTCSSHYEYWKKEVLNASDSVSRKKAMERAFFWLEAQSSLLILWTIENMNENNSETQQKIFDAKTNLSRKLIDYAEDILKEL